MTTPPARFTIGSRYALTLVGSGHVHIVYEVLARTAAFVTVTDGSRVIRCKVKADLWDGGDMIYPMGRNSMSPALRARGGRGMINGKIIDELAPGPYWTPAP